MGVKNELKTLEILTALTTYLSPHFKSVQYHIANDVQERPQS